MEQLLVLVPLMGQLRRSLNCGHPAWAGSGSLAVQPPESGRRMLTPAG